MIENLENEQWLPIDGFDGMYLISNYGRVKSLNYNRTNQEKILKSATNNKGYQVVVLCKDGKQKMFRVHRLVAMAFIPNPNNYTEVNHIDECKTNNHVSNLEWCTVEYNNNYGTRNKKISKALIGKFSGDNNPKYWFEKFGKEHPRSKQVIQLTLDGDYIKSWDSAIDVKRKLGYNQGNIGSCCRGARKSANGYKWQFALIKKR